MFQKILIANRGEIACRIIQTTQKIGIQSVAIFSPNEADAKHVQMADQAFSLESNALQDSYLNAKKIIDIALKSNAQAIHPGYGFLSENTELAKLCEQNQLVFIGPSIQALSLMGNKNKSKDFVAQLGLPVLSGYHDSEQATSHLIKEAKKIGFPLLIKAALGGGGKGMRIVSKADELEHAIRCSQSEASKAFSDPTLLLERYINKPRHIEVQILADRHGHVITLGDRDCSIQRRHQKIIEEAPAPNLSDDLRKKMSQASVAIAKKIKYVGAGTIEFLVDDKESFYFMEMNTRLQVEHGVTEMVTGVDLVAWQIHIAHNEPLTLQQKDMLLCGHAIEARIYAEDPYNEFLPCTGEIFGLNEPNLSDVRIDSSLQQGQNITTQFDPMLSKVMAHGTNRIQAKQKLLQALKQYSIAGVTHNIDYLTQLLSHSAFDETNVNTAFIPDHQADLRPCREPEKAALFVGFYQLLKKQQTTSAEPWAAHNAWRLNRPTTYRFKLQDNHGTTYPISLRPSTQGYKTSSEGGTIEGVLTAEGCHITYQKQKVSVLIQEQHDAFQIMYDQHTYKFTNYRYQAESQVKSEGELHAPMNGVVVTHLVRAGSQVKAGEHLLVLEAMKMEYTIKAPFDGHVQKFLVQEGEQVSDGSKLIDMEALA